jgi:hypothetical protein
MSFTLEEKEQLYKEFKERMFPEYQELMYLNMPRIIGNLIDQHLNNAKIKEGLYSKRPEFKKRPDVVASIMQKIEGNNTLMNPDEIIEKAIPEIDKILKDIKPLDLETVGKRPNLSINGDL